MGAKSEEAELPDNWELQRQQLVEEIQSTVEKIEARLAGLDTRRGPSEVRQPETGWTAEELLEVLRPVYPAAEDASPSDLVMLMAGRIRRVENPEFTSRRSSQLRTASEYLFDRTDALMTAALAWGDTEARVQATMAREELGQLRDPRWVAPGLEDSNPAVRFTAVACLAFLPGSDVDDSINAYTQRESDRELLAAAEWAEYWSSEGPSALCSGGVQTESITA